MIEEPRRVRRGAAIATGTEATRTDGVVETGGEGGRFGEQRLTRAVAEADAPEGAVAAVEHALRDFAGERAGDDAAMVAVMRTAVRAPALAHRPGRAGSAG